MLDINALTRQVIGAAMEVSNTLGCGYLEKVYERAFIVELRRRGIVAECQVPIRVYYKDELVGDYIADLLVEGVLLVELKCVETLTDAHMAQCLNYLAGTGLQIVLLINFQHPRLQWKRIVRALENPRSSASICGPEDLVRDAEDVE